MNSHILQLCRKYPQAMFENSKLDLNNALTLLSPLLWNEPSTSGRKTWRKNSKHQIQALTVTTLNWSLYLRQRAPRSSQLSWDLARIPNWTDSTHAVLHVKDVVNNPSIRPGRNHGVLKTQLRSSPIAVEPKLGSLLCNHTQLLLLSKSLHVFLNFFNSYNLTTFRSQFRRSPFFRFWKGWPHLRLCPKPNWQY